MNLQKNEYGKPRFNENKFSLESIQGEETKVRHLIDLDCVYKLSKVIEITNNQELIDFKQIYLKFYRDGKVAIFEENNIDGLNPKKATMGIYQYKENKLYFEYFSYSKQAGYFRSKQELFIENNKLNEKDTYYKGTYEKIDLWSKTDIKPDW